jgi:hypothetical protein
MDVFDELPPAVRCAIATANFPFNPLIAFRFLRRGVSDERLAKLILAVDSRLSARVM